MTLYMLVYIILHRNGFQLLLSAGEEKFCTNSPSRKLGPQTRRQVILRDSHQNQKEVADQGHEPTVSVQQLRQAKLVIQLGRKNQDYY